MRLPQGSPAVVGRRKQRDPDGGEQDRHDELDQPADVEQVGQDPAEQARGDADERRREQADVLPPGEHEPPERADDETGSDEPEE